MTEQEKLSVEILDGIREAEKIIMEAKTILGELETDILSGNGTDVYYADQIKKVLEML